MVFAILLVYWFLLHTAITISKFILLVCLLLSGLLNSHHRFTLRISKNKSIQFVFLHVFYARFYGNLSFYIQLLIHSYPFSTVLSLDLTRFQPFSVWTLYSLFGHLQCITSHDSIDSSLNCQGQCFFKAKSKTCLNSGTKVDLLRDMEIQSSYKSHLPGLI